MVCEYGMSKKVGPQNFGNSSQPVFLGQGMTGSQEYSEKTANIIDEEVQRILTTAYDSCMKLLVKNKDKLINLSEILIEKEILDAEEVESILETGSLPKVGNDSKEDVEVKQESDT